MIKPISKKKKVLLIGWDAADWKVINPLIEQGKMPNLANLIDNGTSGNIATLKPALSPTLWTSIATGKRPYKHGIHGFSEPDPITGSIRPVTNLSRKTKAIWNILNQEEKDTLTIGWWPSNPAEPLSKGVMVANNFQKANSHTYEPEKWPMNPESVYPDHLTERVKELRFHPAEITQDEILAFMPGLKGLTQEELDKAAKEPRMQSLLKTIADCTSIQSAATSLLESESWDLACVYYDAIDHFGHAFMKFHPPQQDEVSDWEFRLFNYIVEAGYRYHDMLLGTLIRQVRKIDPQTTIMLISDHGFHPDHLRITNMPNEPAGPAAEHRQFGIFVANGPGIVKGGKIYGASLIDICPTLLHHFNLPIGEDMDGKVLLDIFESPAKSIERISSWDEVEGDHGMHPPNKHISAEDSTAALEQLVALGYIEEPDADASKALNETVRELEYNLSQAWMDGGIYTEAISILERLYKEWPMEHRFGYQLLLCYKSLNRVLEIRELVSTMIKRRLKTAEEATKIIKSLNLEDKATQDLEKKKMEKMSPKAKKKFAKERKDLIIASRPNLYFLHYLEAFADYADKKYESVLEKLNNLSGDCGEMSQSLHLKGQTLGKLHRWNEALEVYQQILEIDPEISSALVGVARVKMAQRNFKEVVYYANEAVKLVFFQPKTHYLLGLAYYRLGKIELAEQSFLLSVKQAPLLAASWRKLATIAKFNQHDISKIVYYKEQLRRSKELRKSLDDQDLEIVAKSKSMAHTEPFGINFNVHQSTTDDNVITVVTGLPRSGTSLMMQILEAAQIKAFTDGKRDADLSNEKGYYEHELVMKLRQHTNKEWLKEAQGHALKVVAPLLNNLPGKPLPDSTHLQYRVIFMERDLEEVLESQQYMLDRLGKPAQQGDVSKVYQQHVTNAVKWVNHHKIPALKISYEQLVKNPDQALSQIASFLNVTDQIEEMKAVIDPSLYRVRLSRV